ncbi:MAG: hypothetical protein VX399_05385 [SAR324 cluster bacterium]|nr:hypothetical protein [SAR324 cluster bacterium]
MLRAETAAVLELHVQGKGGDAQQMVQEKLRTVLSRKFKLVENNKIKAAHQAVAEVIGPGPCNHTKCLQLMRETLKTDRLFHLRIKQLDGSTQLTLLQASGNEMRVVDDFCGDCGPERFEQMLDEMTTALVEGTGAHSVHIIPMDLSLPTAPVADLPVILPAAPAPPLPPLSSESLYPKVKVDEGGRTEIPQVDIPETAEPEIPEAARDLTAMMSTREDILIFPMVPDLVEEPGGDFIFQVSAFSEILSVSVNGDKQPIRPGAHQAKYSIPYELDPGENSFVVKVQTKLGQSGEEFIIFLETDLVKREEPKPPFQTILILESAMDDNFLSADEGSEKKASSKASMTLLITYNKHFDQDSRMAINGLLMGDSYQQNEFESYQIFFRQLSWDWVEKFSLINSEFKISLGTNNISMKDTDQSSSSDNSTISFQNTCDRIMGQQGEQEKSEYPDLVLKSYNQYSCDQYLGLEGTLKTSETSSWKFSFENRHKKNVPDSGQSGSAYTVGLQYQTKIWDWISNTIKTTIAIYDLQTDSNDYGEQVYSYTLGIPLGFLSLNTLYKQTNTLYRTAGSSGVPEAITKQNVGLELSFPIAGWLIFSGTQQLELKSSNTSGSYQKNLTSVKMTFIF